MAIKTVRIFPPIGIARVGDSAEEYFLGPERRHDTAVPPTGFRDASHAVKRQGARFRLYGYDEKDKLVSELTADSATIEWRLVLANTKASADRFCQKSEIPKPPKVAAVRNASIKSKAARESLNLRAEARLPGTKNAKFADLRASKAAGTAKDLVCQQTLFGKALSLTLGTVTTDPDGRLIALGGHGNAESPTGKSLKDIGLNGFANHDGWYDDVADGPVNAIVTLPDGSKPAVKAGWLIVGPPKFAPELRHIVTLYDTLLQSMLDKKLVKDPALSTRFKPSFAAEVFPILQRAFSLGWIYANGAAEPVQRTFHRAFSKLPEANRTLIFNMLGTPPADVAQRGQHAVGGGSMPKMFSDEYLDVGDGNRVNGTLTPHQYKIMSLWAAGRFIDDWPGHPLPPEQTISPEGLTEAALEPCIGAPLFPGIEASWKLRDECEFSEAFRLNPDKTSAGDITKQMSLPWQSDFRECTAEPAGGEEFVWWPAQRPIDVVQAGKYVPWVRTDDLDGVKDKDLPQLLLKLGFVLRQADGTFAEADAFFEVMQRGEFEPDVAIIGAGPAGATAAIALAKRGYTVAILEQLKSPRPRFGETLPRTAERILREVDVWDEFVRAQYASWSRHLSAWGASELTYLDLLFQGSGTGWFLNRSTFDAILQTRAASVGCALHRGATIRSSERQQSRWRLRFTRQRKEFYLSARFLIDAAGRTGHRWLRPFPQRTITDYMIATAFVFPRNTDEHYTLVETVPLGWFYSASAHQHFVLLFMTDPDLHASLPALAAEQLQEAPHTLKRLGVPVQSAAQTFTLAAGSALRNCVATDNWVAAGDARMTLDPLSSSGVLSALRSGRDAAQLIVEVDGGIHGAVHGFRDQTMKMYDKYLRERQYYYGCERRWLDTEFWLRRALPRQGPRPDHP